MAVRILNVNMTRGEITPLMHMRVDSELYQSAVKTLRNGVVLRYGGVARAPGFEYMGALATDAAACYLLPFVFNAAQVYVIEASAEKFRFWTRDGQVMDGGTPYEVSTPYAAGDLKNIQYWQSGDLVYLACEGYQMRELRRRGETDWVLAKHVTYDGPYLPINTTATTLTPADTAHATPLMRSNTTPSGVASSSNGSAGAYRMLNRDYTGSKVGLSSSSDGFFKYDFGVGSAVVVDNYSVTAGSDENQDHDAPTAWKFQGSNDDVEWVTLDTQNSVTGLVSSETRYFETDNKAPFRYYRLSYTNGGGPDSNLAVLGELSMHLAPTAQTPFNLTASSTDGINDGLGFVASDVGRPVRLLGGDGQWRWCEIKQYVSSTVVKLVMHGQALEDTQPIVTWRLGAWSDTSGWPRAIGSFEDRLTTASTTSEPYTVWSSRNADYDSHEVSSPLVDDDGVSVRMTPGGGQGGLDAIKWLVGNLNIVVGTEGEIKAAGPRDTGAAYSSSNVRQLRPTKQGANGMTPLLEGVAMLFMDEYGRRLLEVVYSAEADGYIPQEISVLNAHLLKEGVVRWAFQKSPNRIIWAVKADGNLLAMTYDRDQKVFGVAARDVDGFVDDVVAIPGDGMDDVFISVRRQVDGATKGYLEKLAPFFDAAAHDYPMYYDCATTTTTFTVGAASAGQYPVTVSGADYLEGATIGVWVDGLDVGDAIVASGSFTVSVSQAAPERVVYGLRIPFAVRTLPLAQWDAQDGGGPGRNVRVIDSYVGLLETGHMASGDQRDPVRFDPPLDDAQAAPELRTGVFHLSDADSTWSGGGELELATDKGYPATVTGIIVHAEGAD